MGNAQSLTRTSGALDLFVAELGGDIVYEGRCAYMLAVLPGRTHRHTQFGLGAVFEDCEMSTQERVLGREDLHQARPGHEFAEVPQKAKGCVHFPVRDRCSESNVPQLSAKLLLIYPTCMDTNPLWRRTRRDM